MSHALRIGDDMIATNNVTIDHIDVDHLLDFALEAGFRLYQTKVYDAIQALTEDEPHVMTAALHNASCVIFDHEDEIKSVIRDRLACDKITWRELSDTYYDDSYPEAEMFIDQTLKNFDHVFEISYDGYHNVVGFVTHNEYLYNKSEEEWNDEAMAALGDHLMTMYVKELRRHGAEYAKLIKTDKDRMSYVEDIEDAAGDLINDAITREAKWNEIVMRTHEGIMSNETTYAWLEVVSDEADKQAKQIFNGDDLPIY